MSRARKPKASAAVASPAASKMGLRWPFTPVSGGVQLPARAAIPPPPGAPMPTMPAPPATATPPADAAPAPAAAAPPAPAPAGPEGLGVHAGMVNSYEQQRRTRDAYRWKMNRDIPQGETLLVHAWSFAVSQYPATALTVWLRRVDPLTGAYEFFIPGDALIGDFPDRKIFEEVRRHRRQPTIAEKFVGRIRYVTPEGTTAELQGGEIHLPPEPPQTASAPWAAPQMPAYAPGPPPWGYPWPGQAGPYGGPPGSYGVPPSMPWPWGTLGMAAALQAPTAAPAPPPAQIQNNPDLVALWTAMQESVRAAQAPQQALMQTLIERAFAQQPQTAATSGQAPGLLDQVKAFGQMAEALDKIRGPQQPSEHRGLNIHKVGESLLVENKDGDIDPVATAIVGGMPALTGIKDLIKSAAARRSAMIGRGQGVQLPAKTPAAATTVTATETNGAKPKQLS